MRTSFEEKVRLHPWLRWVQPLSLCGRSCSVSLNKAKVSAADQLLRRCFPVKIWARCVQHPSSSGSELPVDSIKTKVSAAALLWGKAFKASQGRGVLGEAGGSTFWGACLSVG